MPAHAVAKIMAVTKETLLIVCDLRRVAAELVLDPKLSCCNTTLYDVTLRIGPRIPKLSLMALESTLCSHDSNQIWDDRLTSISHNHQPNLRLEAAVSGGFRFPLAKQESGSKSESFGTPSTYPDHLLALMRRRSSSRAAPRRTTDLSAAIPELRISSWRKSHRLLV